MNESYLFTIAIPTYNRAGYLDLCLNCICKQITDINIQKIEIIVSDNSSTDSTESVVSEYINAGQRIKYIKNQYNFGADRNILQCFNQAKGKYVLVLGDDDVLIEDALDKIIDILEKNDYGLVFLPSYSFQNNYLLEKPKYKVCENIIYTKNEYLKMVSYFITFISGNICNKSIVGERFRCENFIGTNLIQVACYLEVLVHSKDNLYIGDLLIGSKADNTGGYSLYKVFGINFNEILSAYEKCGISTNTIKHINNDMLRKFFPFTILKMRINKGKFQDVFIYEEMKKIYKNNIFFPIFVAPIIKMPLNLSKKYLFAIRVINKIITLLQRN